MDKEFNKNQELLKLQQVAIELIFIVHATISDQTKELSSSEQPLDQEGLLKKVFKAHLPGLALKQFAEITLALVDRIIAIPSQWMKAVTPLILWLSLHFGDGLVEAIFEVCPTLKQELCRLHMLLTDYTNMKLKSYDDEESQLKLLQLTGSTLLPEESILVGFLPLMSHFNTKKDIKTGVKCPADQEDFVRAIIFKEALEKIQCTHDKAQKPAK